MLRPILIFLATTTVIFAPTTILAGSYVLDHYSGGQTTSTGFGTLTGGYSGTASWGAGIDSGGAVVGPGTASCGNQIEAVLKWHSDTGEDPPPIAILKESCMATWRGDSGSCSNGLGSSAVATTNGADSSGDKWSVIEDPGDTIHVYCTPTASATIAFPSATGMISAEATVDYAAVAYPVDVAITGTKSATDLRLMIGQKLTAQVTYPSALNSGSNTYSWHISGGDPFSAYSPKDADATNSSYTSWASTNSSSTNVYFADPDSNTVGVDIHLAVPNKNFTIDKTIVSLNPSVTQTVNIGTAQIATAGPGFGFTYGMRLWGVTTTMLVGNSSQSFTTGIAFLGQVVTPDDFVIDEDHAGIFYWTQVATSINRWYKNSLGDYYDSNGNFSGGTPKLDLINPYQQATSYCGGYDSALPGIHDSPGIGIKTGLMDQVSATDHFKTTLMYIPPGATSMPVPLKVVNWWWQGQAELSGVDWIMTSHDQSQSDGGSYPAHPIWVGKVITSGYSLR